MTVLSPDDARWPRLLTARLGDAAPKRITAQGNLDLLALPKTALFCSGHCPGSIILPTYDQAAKWRDTGRCVIGGFHSPLEKECLRILLRGDAPVILCPARGMLQRLPAQWDIAVASGRMLILSAFPAKATRISAELAARRNEFVAALADEVYIAHATAGGNLEKPTERVRAWGTPLQTANRDIDGDRAKR